MKMSLSDVRSKGSGLPNRYIVHAVEGWGKTTFGAQFPKPIFIQTRGETGLETLIDAGQLPEVPHFPAVESWEALSAAIDVLRGEHDFRTLIIDTINGAERLCHEHICNREFGGIWGDKGFGGYQRGFEVSLAEWTIFLNALDTIRMTRNMTIICLCHTKVGTFKNPEGPDYDRYQPDMNAKTWSLTHKWADVVLFGNFETIVQTEKAGAKKGKGSGGQQRMLYTQRHASYDAKNRLGLPEEIDMGSSPEEAWTSFKQAVVEGRKQGVTNG